MIPFSARPPVQHHHLWDWREPHVDGKNPGVNLDWDPNVMESKVYYADEYARDIRRGGHRVVQTVYLECGMRYRDNGPVAMRCVGETEFAESQARPGDGMVVGIVGSVNLQLGAEAVDAVLTAHLAASPNFKGVRTAFPDDLNEQWQAGYAALGARGLSVRPPPPPPPTHTHTHTHICAHTHTTTTTPVLSAGSLTNCLRRILNLVGGRLRA